MSETPESQATEQRLGQLSRLRDQWLANPSSRQFVQLAEEFRRLGEPATAASLLERGLEEHPRYLSAQVALARCRLDLGEARAATVLLEAVVVADSTHPLATRLLVEAYAEVGQFALAQEKLDLYRLLNSGDPQIEVLEARVAGRTGAAAPAVLPPPPPAEGATEAATEASESGSGGHVAAAPRVPGPAHYTAGTGLSAPFDAVGERASAVGAFPTFRRRTSLRAPFASLSAEAGGASRVRSVGGEAGLDAERDGLASPFPGLAIVASPPATATALSESVQPAGPELLETPSRLDEVGEAQAETDSGESFARPELAALTEEQGVTRDRFEPSREQWERADSASESESEPDSGAPQSEALEVDAPELEGVVVQAANLEAVASTGLGPREVDGPEADEPEPLGLPTLEPMRESPEPTDVEAAEEEDRRAELGAPAGLPEDALALERPAIERTDRSAEPPAETAAPASEAERPPLEPISDAVDQDGLASAAAETLGSTGPWPAAAMETDGPALAETLDGEDQLPAETTTLGLLYLRQGHPVEAERILRRVLEREPANDLARDALRRARIEADFGKGGSGPVPLGTTERKVRRLRGWMSRLRG